MKKRSKSSESIFYLKFKKENSNKMININEYLIQFKSFEIGNSIEYALHGTDEWITIIWEKICAYKWKKYAQKKNVT